MGARCGTVLYTTRYGTVQHCTIWYQKLRCTSSAVVFHDVALVCCNFHFADLVCRWYGIQHVCVTRVLVGFEGVVVVGIIESIAVLTLVVLSTISLNSFDGE